MVGVIRLDHDGSLHYCDVWFRTDINFEGEGLDVEIMDGVFKEGCIKYGGYSGPKGDNPSVPNKSDFF